MTNWHETRDWQGWQNFPLIEWDDPADAQWREWRQFEGTVFLCGHGTHEMSKGFTKVPQGTTVVLYGYYGYRIIQAQHVLPILSGKAEEEGWEQDRVIEEYMYCPNLTLSRDDDALVEQSASALNERYLKHKAFRKQNNLAKAKIYPYRIFNINQFNLSTNSLSLTEIITKLPGNRFVWTCCQELIQKSAEAPRDPVLKFGPATEKRSQEIEEEAEAQADQAYVRSRSQTVDRYSRYANFFPTPKELRKLAVNRSIKDVVRAAQDILEDLDLIGDGYHQNAGKTFFKHNAFYSMHHESAKAERGNYDKIRLSRDSLLEVLRKLIQIDQSALTIAASQPEFEQYKGWENFKRKVLLDLLPVAPKHALLQIETEASAMNDMESRTLISRELQRRR